ncbi:MAG: tetratricopeptide repeat protein [Propionibacteriaceae bacterium]|nr:tetratricopeptide repeat protein [Propionibacteriaceae bacterium]
MARFLASAPVGLKAWADEQLAALDIAPETDPADGDAVGVEEFADDFDEIPNNATGESGQDAEQPAGSPAARARPSKPRAKNSAVGGKINLVLVALLVAAIVIIVQQTGITNRESASSQGAASGMPSGMSTFAQIDQARVDELKAQIDADPSNTAARQQLAELYLDAALYQDAIEQLDQVLQITPDDLDALLAIGVAEFNLSQDEQAEQHWLRATQVAPAQAEPWYNLGFLYMAQTPPDYDKVEQAWGRVIELDPDSELAATARAHLERARAASPTPSTGP